MLTHICCTCTHTHHALHTAYLRYQAQPACLAYREGGLFFFGACHRRTPRATAPSHGSVGKHPDETHLFRCLGIGHHPTAFALGAPSEEEKVMRALPRPAPMPPMPASPAEPSVLGGPSSVGAPVSLGGPTYPCPRQIDVWLRKKRREHCWPAGL